MPLLNPRLLLWKKVEKLQLLAKKRGLDLSMRDVLRAVCHASKVPSIGDLDFFEKLANEPIDTDPGEWIFFDECSAMLSQLVSPPPDNNMRYEKATGDTVRVWEGQPTDPYRSPGIEQTKEDMDNARIVMSGRQCATLRAAGAVAFGRPDHSMWAEYHKDGSVMINDIVHSSLQTPEDVYNMRFDPEHTLYPSNEGWCHTWSWFELECNLMGCAGIHQTLCEYYWSSENADNLWDGVPVPDPLIDRLQAALKPKHPGLLLTELVHRLAERYMWLITRKVETSDLLRAAAPTPTHTVPFRGESWVPHMFPSFHPHFPQWPTMDYPDMIWRRRDPYAPSIEHIMKCEGSVIDACA